MSHVICNRTMYYDMSHMNICNKVQCHSSESIKKFLRAFTVHKNVKKNEKWKVDDVGGEEEEE